MVNLTQFTYSVIANKEFIGVSLSEYNNVTISTCSDRCSLDFNCFGFMIKNQSLTSSTCYLKKNEADNIASINTVSYYKSYMPYLPVLVSNTTIYHNDLESIYLASESQCYQACDSIMECKGTSFNTRTTECKLKNGIDSIYQQHLVHVNSYFKSSSFNSDLPRYSVLENAEYALSNTLISLFVASKDQCQTICDNSFNCQGFWIEKSPRVVRIPINVIFRQFTVTGSTVCGVNDLLDLYCGDLVVGEDLNLLLKPTLQPGTNRISDITGYGTQMCAVSVITIYGSTTIQPPIWSTKTGSMIQQSASTTHVCGVAWDFRIYCRPWSNLSTERFSKAPFRYVTISGTKVCAIDTSGVLACDDDFFTTSLYAFTSNMLNLQKVEMNGDVVCGITASNDIVCSNYKEDNWKSIGMQANHIEIDSNNLYLSTIDNFVIFKNISGYLLDSNYSNTQYNCTTKSVINVAIPSNKPNCSSIAKYESVTPRSILYTSVALNQISVSGSTLCGVTLTNAQYYSSK